MKMLTTNMCKKVFGILFLLVSVQPSRAQQSSAKGETFTITVWVKNPNSSQVFADIDPITLALRPVKHNQQKMLLDPANKATLTTVLKGPSVVKLLNVWPDSTISYIAIPGANLSIHLDGGRKDTSSNNDVGPGETRFYNDILERCRVRLRNIPQQDPQQYLDSWSQQFDEMQQLVTSAASSGMSPVYTSWISQSIHSLFRSELSRQLVTFTTMTGTWPINFKAYQEKIGSLTDAVLNQPALFSRQTDKELVESYYLYRSLVELNSKGLPAPAPAPTYRAAIDRANKLKAESSRDLMLRYLCSTAIAFTTDTSLLKWMNTSITFDNHTQHIKKLLTDKQNLLRKAGKGKQAPFFAASDIFGNSFSYDNYKGKYLFIDIWATWCVPCRKEIPYLDQLKQKYAGKPIEFVSVSIDDNYGAWKRFVESTDATNQFHSPNSRPSGVSEVFSAALIPEFVLIDPQGKIVNPRTFRPSDPALTFLLDQLLQTTNYKTTQK
jgi:thiol-disulfide isomerase/thioredoxin